MTLTTDFKQWFSLTLIIFFILNHNLNAEESSSPFVAGFDRFARHDQINLKTGGRLLISELSCTACHSSSDNLLQPKLGPNLTAAGSRLQNKWIKQYLNNPQTTKPGTTMPDILHSLPVKEKRETIEALSAFLTSNQKPFPVLKSTGVVPLPLEYWKKGNPEIGEELYHQIGCVACHEADKNYEGGAKGLSLFEKQLEQLDPEDIEDLGLSHVMRPVNSIPLPNLKEKYNLKSLLFFLLNPETVRSAGRMPNLKLKTMEAANLAAYLLKDQKSKTENKTTASESLIKKGKELFVQLKCINCHQVDGIKVSQKSITLEKLNFSNNNCVTQTTNNLPEFNLDQQQLESVKQALTELKNKPINNPVSQNAILNHQLLKLNCYACHERTKQGGIGKNKKRFFETVGDIDIGDEGRFPPDLTGLGNKLQQSWMKNVLDGNTTTRPFMTIRMPKFPIKETVKLPESFAIADGYQKVSEKTLFGSKNNLAKEGRELINNGCVQCHQINGEQLPGVVGVDLLDISKRVHPKWFHDFLVNPGNLKNRTRMPTFFPEGKSSNTKILDGNMDRQIAAIWAYLKEIKKHPLPEKIITSKSLDTELVPKTAPILIRTFMKEAGTHTIAVGFPEKVHYAFDAENIRLAQTWKGRFLDAGGTWYVRSAPPAPPLGTNIISMPAGTPFAIFSNSEQKWPLKNPFIQFLGYQLDKKKIPRFSYRLKQYDIHDKIIPDDNKGFIRIIQVSNRKPHSNQDQLYFLINSGKELKSKTPFSYTNNSGLTTIVSESLFKQALIRKADNESHWLLPINSISEFKVVYQW